MEHLWNDHEDRPNQHENSHKSMKQGILFEFIWKAMETETATWSEFSNDGKAILEQILAPEERNKYKRAELWESRITVWDSSRKVNRLSKVVWDRTIITECTRSTNFTRIGTPFLMMHFKVSKEKQFGWVGRENLIYVRWNRIKNCL